MNKKRDPIGPSDFVPDILKPLRQFVELDTVRQRIEESVRKTWATEVFETTVDR